MSAAQRLPFPQSGNRAWSNGRCAKLAWRGRDVRMHGKQRDRGLALVTQLVREERERTLKLGKIANFGLQKRIGRNGGGRHARMIF